MHIPTAVLPSVAEAGIVGPRTTAMMIAAMVLIVIGNVFRVSITGLPGDFPTNKQLNNCILSGFQRKMSPFDKNQSVRHPSSSANVVSFCKLARHPGDIGTSAEGPCCVAATRCRDCDEGRQGFARLFDRIEGNGVCTVIVEDASRFARELVVQELGIALLDKRGVRLLTVSGDDLTDSNDLGRKTMRQVAGAFMEYEKGPSGCEATGCPGTQTQGDRQEGRRPEITR